MKDPAVLVENLSKRYWLGSGTAGHGTLYDQIGQLLRAPFQRASNGRTSTTGAETFLALQDVSFELRPGEVAGVIGRNGAGKSTLLKILSRITAPTSGRVMFRGRLASLLEVGTGFHPELSGRENIYLNGAILGMTRAEVSRKFDQIVDFAEIEKFVDTPVKHYSSGMYVRLAFAVAAHLETDILLVDEVLAVGDAQFQRKSLGKMNEAARSGRTVVFVSHNLSAVRQLCTKALLLERGQLIFDGAVNEGLAAYEKSFSTGGLTDDAHFEGSLKAEVTFERLVCRQGGTVVTAIDPLAALELELVGIAARAYPSFELKIALFRDGIHVCSCHDSPVAQPLQRGQFVSTFQIPADVFRSGRYTLGVGATASTEWVWGADVAVLDFSDNRGNRSQDRSSGVIAIPYTATRYP